MDRKQTGRKVRVVRGVGAAAGLWVVELLTDTGGWRQAALPDRTRWDARQTAALVREHGAFLGGR